MPKIRIKDDFHNYIDRHGKQRSYYGRGKGAVALTARPIGSPEWVAQYLQAKAGKVVVGVGSDRSAEGTFNAAIAAIIASTEFRKLKRRDAYDAPFAFLRERVGKASVAVIKRRQINELLSQAEAESVGARNILLVAIRRVMSYAIQNEWRDDNPTLEIDKLLSEDHDPLGRFCWTAPLIEQYRRHHPIGTMARLALEIGFATGLRISDACRLGRQHLRADGKSFEITPKKTEKFGTIVAQPIRDPMLLAALAAAPVRGQRAFLCTVTGKDFSDNTLGDNFATWCKEAKLPDACRFHGLRKACAVRLSHAGASTHEIMAWIGDKDPKMVELYTKSRDTWLLSESGADKLDALAVRG